LAVELRTKTVKAFVAETTDALCGLIDAHPVDLILIENAHYGFLSAAEVLARLQSAQSPPQIVMVGDSQEFSAGQSRSLHIAHGIGEGSQNAK
jgi:hypothetical protein